MKKFLSIALTLVMLSTLITLPSMAANVIEEPDQIIWQDDFSSDKAYPLSDTGTLSDGKYAMSNGTRIIKNISQLVSGAYEVEVTYNFSKVEKVDGLLRVGDNTGNYYGCYLDVNGGKLQLREISSGKITPTATHELLTVQPEIDYTVTLRFSLDSKALEIYINGTRYLSGKSLLFNADCPNIYRVFDSQVGTNDAEFTIDNLSIRKINPDLLKSGSVIFEEDFEGGYGSGYAAKPSGTTSIESINGSDAFLYSTNRLTTNHTIGKGKINLSFDLTLASISSDSAIVIQSSDSNGKPVWRLRVNKSGELYADTASQKGATTIGTMNSGKLTTLKLNTPYKIDVEYDTESKVMNVYVDGLKRNSNNLYIKTNTTNYNRVLDENPDYLGKGNASFYLDNIRITKKQSDSEETIVRETFDKLTTVFSPKGDVSDGAMKISDGVRALNTLNGYLVDSTSVFNVNTDITFTATENSSSTRGIMAPQTVLESSVYEIFGLYEKDGALLVRTYFDKDDTQSYMYLPIVDNISLNQTYKFGYTINLSSRRVHFFIDNIEVYPQYQLYMNPSCVGNFTRPADFNNNGTIGANEVIVDNYYVCKDIALSSIPFESTWKSGEVTLPAQTLDGRTIKWYGNAATSIETVSSEQQGKITLNAVIPVGTAYDMRTFTLYFPSNESSPVINANGKVVSAEVKNCDNSTLYFALYSFENGIPVLESISVGGYNVDNICTLSVEDLSGLDNGNYTLKAFYWENGTSVPHGICDELDFTIVDGTIEYN